MTLFLVAVAAATGFILGLVVNEARRDQPVRRRSLKRRRAIPGLARSERSRGSGLKPGSISSGEPWDRPTEF